MCQRTLELVILLALAPAAIAVLPGCTVVNQTVYLQDASVTTPHTPPPVFVTNNAAAFKLRIMPFVSIGRDEQVNALIPGHSPVNSRGAYQVDTVMEDGHPVLVEPVGTNAYDFKGKNFHWMAPGTVVGLNGEFTLSRNVAFTFGANYAQGESDGFWGGSLGCGVFTEGPVLGIRFDSGVQWHSVAYDIPTVIVTQEVSAFNTFPSYVTFYRDKGKDTYMNFYLSCTINSRLPDSYVNGFINLGLARESLVSLEPRSRVTTLLAHAYTPGAEAGYSTTFYIITPGVSFEVGPSQRLLVGARLFLGSELRDYVASTAPAPFVQFDLVF